ncbi:SubName: Full=Uncharacterized protein {ECO:0000313/EMBL:CCA76088.1} [Serendipita indica DSM 11827]|nr:SubName: Full=Uncharacterized protein {ECO:0000313/EMBL:CCA76088.1} [Serendipita indica DSM 11827]
MSQYENESKPDPAGTTSAMLELTAGATQDFTPVKSICAFLNAYHVYADDTARPPVDSYHYCAHIEPEMRQCIIYDSPRINARLIGIEYLISPRLYQTLPKEEKKLWHSHAYEVKSGMLIMAKPGVVPNVVWQAAENKEMEMLVDWYGKTYHLWQIDLKNLVRDRDERFSTNTGQNRAARAYIPTPKIDPDADN